VEVLLRMEREGIGLDGDRLRALSREMEGRIRQAEERVFALAGETFNLGSPQQLGKVLFEKMEIQKSPGAPKVRRTKTGYSTDAEVLDQFASHPVVREILEHRSLSKLRNTYLDALPKFIHPRTGRIHTSFHQTGAATGRLSSSEPNLQNIPVRSAEGKEIRAAFVAGQDGCLLLSADYSQIELRVLAHLSGDPGLVAAFAAGEDIHRRTAAAVFDVDPRDVSDEMRRRAKVVNYGIVYGMGAQRLARETRCSLDEARAFIDAYFARCPKIQEYLEGIKRRAREDGFVSTLLGRRRAFPDILSANRAIQQNAERAAINTPIQGSAADIIKVAMVEIDREIRKRGMASRMIIQVHDELLVPVPEGEVADLRALVTERMEGCVDLAVPLVVDVGVGRNWLEAH
jgi:DNA polymerase-1